MRERDLSGTVLDGRYQLIERLAEGAMGVVYRGISIAVERAVAVKLMHNSLPGDGSARERFQREAKLMALVDHPHCVSVIDYGLHGGKPFLVMELVRGRSLHDVLADQRRVEIERAVDIIRQVLSGLAYAHEQGIIHRDIKPANIMVTPKAPLGVHVRILDFGLARLLEANSSLTSGFAVGTPSYMAPEQCRGDALDPRVDIYAAGITLFEMLTGKKPFVASDPIEIIKLQLNEPPPRLSEVIGGNFGKLEDVVARALAKAPADRYANVIAMSEAIGAALSATPIPEVTATHLSLGDLTPAEPSSGTVPITVGSSVIERRAPPPADSNDASLLRRMLPVSRIRYVALGCVLLIAAAVYAIVVLTRESDDAVIATPPPVVRDASPDVAPPPDDAAAAAPTKSDELVAAGKGYFAKLWWADGIKSFRDAIKLDPSYRSNPELIKAAVRGFITTPQYDARLGGFLAELGDAARTELDEVARTHANPQVRARAAAQLQRIK